MKRTHVSQREIAIKREVDSLVGNTEAEHQNKQQYAIESEVHVDDSRAKPPPSFINEFLCVVSLIDIDRNLHLKD